ncbi:MAG TPA: SCO family protein [Polyangiaceae bacterium]
MKHPRVAPTTVSAAALASCLLVGAGEARAQQWTQQSDQPVENATPPILTGVDIVENLGGALPRDATFRDTEGKTVRLGDFFDGKRPTLFVFAYHTCPMLCSLVLDATVKSLNDVAWSVGDQFDVVSVSIDPKDTPETATKKRAQVVDSYPRAHGNTKGWHFLTGEESEIRKVTDAIGFKYQYDPRQKQFAHPAAIYLLTPEGHIARYLYGISYDPSDVRLGLLEATEGRSISTTERILLYCYHYDPQGKKYSLVAMNVMRLGGGVTLVALGSFLTLMWVRERRKRRQRDSATSSSAQVAPPARDATGAHLS